MITQDIEEAKELSRQHGFTFTVLNDSPTGSFHCRISDDNIIVDWWPLSKKRSAYRVTTGESFKGVTPIRLMAIATDLE